MTASPTTKTTQAPSTATPDAFTWYDQWYPVAFEADLPDRPHAFTLWDKPYVIYRDPLTASYTVLDDICPHRSAPLSEGRITTRATSEGKKQTVLECGYHGWQFDPCGTCVRIPQRDPAKAIPSRASAVSYVTRVGLGGLIFVFLGNPDRADTKPLPFSDRFQDVEAKDVFVFRNGARTFPISFTNIIENVTDPVHVAFAHHGTGQGDRTAVSHEGRMQILEENHSRMVSRFQFTADAARSLRIFMLPPVGVCYEADVGSSCFAIMTWTVPISANRSCMYSQIAFLKPSRMIKFLGGLKPRWWEHLTMNMILDGDSVLLQCQQEHLNSIERDVHGGAWKKAYLLTSSTTDNMVTCYRRWLDSNSDTMPYVYKNENVERLPIEMVNDRYEHHTKDCRACRPVLERARLANLLGIAVASLGAVVASCANVCRILEVGKAAAVGRLSIYGGVGVATGLLCVAVCRWIIRMMTFTRLAYRLSHKD